MLANRLSLGERVSRAQNGPLFVSVDRMQMSLLILFRWCAAKPVATNGFTLTGMKANTHLVNISVRCQNELGWSDPSEVVPEVFTEGNKGLYKKGGVTMGQKSPVMKSIKETVLRAVQTHVGARDYYPLDCSLSFID